MAKLAKRTAVPRRPGRRHGAGPFHYPQKPGRTNHFGSVPEEGMIERQLVTAQPRALDPGVLDQLAQRRRNTRVLRKALDRLARRRAA